jgi:hypothetical protein
MLMKQRDTSKNLSGFSMTTNKNSKLNFDRWVHYKLGRISMPNEESREHEVRKFIKLKPTLKMAFNTYIEMGLSKKDIMMNMDIILMTLYKSDAPRKNALLWNNLEYVVK